jgi:hypothetical protein
VGQAAALDGVVVVVLLSAVWTSSLEIDDREIAVRNWFVARRMPRDGARLVGTRAFRFFLPSPGTLGVRSASARAVRVRAAYSLSRASRTKVVSQVGKYAATDPSVQDYARWA